MGVCVYEDTHNFSVPVSLILMNASFLLEFSTHGALTQKEDRGETRPQKVHI